MYIIDFAQRLVKKQNIGIFIYLIINTLIVMVLFQNVIVGLVAYIISLMLALSPFGEWILRVQQGCKPLARKEHIDRLMPLFNEVYSRAKELDPSLPNDIKLFLSRDNSPNAFATGRKTICLTRGLLDLSDDKIKATLAHEFGHLSNKDTDFILVVAVGNMIVTFMFVIYRVTAFIVGTAVSIANRSIGSFIFTIFIDLLLIGMMWLWTKFGTMLVMHSSRQNEYEADRFAYLCGYGEPLIHVLDHFNDIDIPDSKGLWANLAASHPDPDQRIGKIQQLEEAI